MASFYHIGEIANTEQDNYGGPFLLFFIFLFFIFCFILKSKIGISIYPFAQLFKFILYSINLIKIKIRCHKDIDKIVGYFII